ncbi:DUF4185 domain-containing protein [Paenibacillus montanisoli]|uniref:DUF4185 domain-containing protein n=1 Tax=Paenibacillus montanisoli TaxID=2081970 RepID=A0A328UB71_9BACL|nr:DUF4185 domain-containing protein [Paenibacillus montanisoli]RAP77534.1 DUF4185 domain-containing protein [Paenibacillus montanisoli]
MRPVLLLAAAALLLAMAGCTSGDKSDPMLSSEGKPFILKGVTDLQQVSQLTGAESPNKTDRFAVYGTDLGSMFNDGDKTYFVFGDTFGERAPDQIGGGGSFWRSNTIGYTTDDDPSDGIKLDGMIADDIGLAAELLPSAKVDYDEMTKIPTHGLSANGAMYLYYMSVNHWGDPGKWDANYSSVAKSTDGGQHWTLLDQLKWPGDSNFIQVSPYKVKAEDGKTDIYFWCIPSGRFGGVQLMKVGEADIEKAGAYRYYAGDDKEGTPIWSEDRSKAKTVVDDTVGELSVVWNPYLERWLMTYLKEGQGVVIREGLAPWGPWGEAIDLVKASDQPGLYGPFMNDRYTADGGKTIYFTLSLWDPYNVFWFRASLQK